MSLGPARKVAHTFEGYVAPKCINHGKPMRETKQCVWRCDVTGCGLVLDAKALEKGWRE